MFGLQKHTAEVKRSLWLALHVSVISCVIVCFVCRYNLYLGFLHANVCLKMMMSAV